MTQTGLLPPQQVSYPPFLPNDFYKAPQYALYRPVDATTLLLVSPKQTDAVARKADWAQQVRANEIRGWLDNLHLMHESYVAKHPGNLAEIRRYSGAVPAMTTTATVAVKKTKGRPKKAVTNRIKPYLADFMFPKDALERLPLFDDIVTGAVHLDAGGNTRPLSKTMMVSLLQVLDEITTAAVQESTNKSLRHAQRIALCLRIIEGLAFKTSQVRWHPPTMIDWSDLD